MTFTVNEMIDENFYYIFEGVGYHPYLKPKIKNYCDDTPFNKADIYMSAEDIQTYKVQKSNLYKLSREFYEYNTINDYTTINNFCQQEIKLDIDQKKISLAIVYSLNDLYSGYSEYKIFGKYYSSGEDILEKYE